MNPTATSSSDRPPGRSLLCLRPRPASCLVAIVLLELAVARPVGALLPRRRTPRSATASGPVLRRAGDRRARRPSCSAARGHRVIGWALGGVGAVLEPRRGLGVLRPARPRRPRTRCPGLDLRACGSWSASPRCSSATIVVLPLIFPDGRFLPGRWGVASWVCMAVDGAQRAGLRRRARREARRRPVDAAARGSTSTRPRSRRPRPFAGVLTGTLQLVTVLGLVVPIGVVVSRYRALSRDRPRPDALAALGRAGHGRVVVLVSLALDLGVAHATPSFFVAITLVPIAMTVAIVNPRWSRSRTCSAGPSSSPRSRSCWSSSTSSWSPC